MWQIGLMDTVMHAGPQLTVGWSTVSQRCKRSQLRTMKNMMELLYPGWGEARECAMEAVNEFHLNYGPNLEKYLSEMGITGQPWCTAGEHLNF